LPENPCPAEEKESKMTLYLPSGIEFPPKSGLRVAGAWVACAGARVSRLGVDCAGRGWRCAGARVKCLCSGGLRGARVAVRRCSGEVFVLGWPLVRGWLLGCSGGENRVCAHGQRSSISFWRTAIMTASIRE
jgi:hypothetical protein